jgi:hypothetical protein
MKLAELLSNKFIRICLMIFFFLFVYKILFAIGVFFAIEPMIISMYLCWIGMLIIFASLLPIKRTLFNVKAPKPIPEPQFKPGLPGVVTGGNLSEIVHV